MRKNLSQAIFVSVILAEIFVACQKKNGSVDTLQQKLTVEDAKSYHQRLESKYGNYDLTKVSGKTVKNFKHVDFSQAYIGENETSFFVEAPITYTTREIYLSTGSSIPTSTLKKMLANSFDRLVIYKDKTSGMFNEKIVTVIPSVDYLTNGQNDLYNNHYQSIVKEFSGYVSNKDWKGKFLSSESYNLGNAGADKVLTSNRITNQTKAARVNDISCNVETIYRGYSWCEDYDEHGNGVNCDYVIISYEANVCDIVSPVFHNHSAPMPGNTAPYWQGWPEPQNIPSPNSCPTTTRVMESPIVYAAVSPGGSSFSMTLYSGCFCQGNSFMILEDVDTGTEYSFLMENQNFPISGCTTLWETNVQIPANVPNGDYFVKVWQDGDSFYHQFEQGDGTITKRFRHFLTR